MRHRLNGILAGDSVDHVNEVAQTGGRSPRTPPGALRRHTSLIVAEALFLIATIAAVARGASGQELVIPPLLILAAVVPLVAEPVVRAAIPGWLQTSYAVLLVCAPFVGSHLHFYAVWPPWDTVVHFYSGFLLAGAVLFAVRTAAQRTGTPVPTWATAVLTLTGGAFGAVLWEISEFTSDLVIGTNAQLTNEDTMVDLIAGTVSAAPVACWVAVRGEPPSPHTGGRRRWKSVARW